MMKRSREEPLLCEPTLPNLEPETTTLRCPTIDNQSVGCNFPAASGITISPNTILAATNRVSMDSDESNSTKRLKATEDEKTHDDGDEVKSIDAVVRPPLRIKVKWNPKSEPEGPKPKPRTPRPKSNSKTKSNPNPKPKPTKEDEPAEPPVSLPFFDSSTPPEEIKATIDSKLEDMKSGLFDALKKIDESFACEVAANIEFDIVKCNGGEKPDGDPFIMKKKLETSDIGHLSRLMLKKEWVKNHILPFWGTEQVNLVESSSGLRVKIYDQDDQSFHTLTLKQWCSNTCYIINKNWSESFVTRRNLKKGDVIGLYWDSFYSHFCFSVLEKA